MLNLIRMPNLIAQALRPERSRHSKVTAILPGIDPEIEGSDGDSAIDCVSLISRQVVRETRR